MRNITPASGSVSIDSILIDEVLTREQAAQAIGLRSVRQLYRYLRLLLIFSPEFKKFEDTKTGRVNGAVKLTQNELLPLMRVRELYQRHRSTELVTIELSKIYAQRN